MVRLVQMLCPLRHCMMAVAYPDTMSDETAKQMLKFNVDNLIRDRVVLNCCAICGSKDFHFEVGQTRFKTVEEAQPALREVERQNQLAQMVLGATKRRN